MNNKPVTYLQTDSRWAKWPYSNKDEDTDIAESGCGPTSAAIVIATWKDSSVTPVTTSQWSLNHGYKATGNGTYHSYFVPQMKVYGIDCERVNTSSLQYYSSSQAKPYHDKALNAVKEGHMVICLMGRGVWTRGGHYIVWYSVDDSNNVYISDPASTKANRLKNKLSTLQNEVRYYWICKVPKEVISMTNSEVTALIKTEVANAVKSSVAGQVTTGINNFLHSLTGSEPDTWAAQQWYSACQAGLFDGSNPKMYLTREQLAIIEARKGTFPLLDLPIDINWDEINQQK